MCALIGPVQLSIENGVYAYIRMSFAPTKSSRESTGCRVTRGCSGSLMLQLQNPNFLWQENLLGNRDNIYGDIVFARSQ